MVANEYPCSGGLIEVPATPLSPHLREKSGLIERRFGLNGSEPATLATVARELRIDTATARKIERSALLKMRTAAGTEPPPDEPCKPAAAVLDLLRNGRREPRPAAAGQQAISRAVQHV